VNKVVRIALLAQPEKEQHDIFSVPINDINVITLRILLKLSILTVCNLSDIESVKIIFKYSSGEVKARDCVIVDAEKGEVLYNLTCEDHQAAGRVVTQIKIYDMIGEAVKARLTFERFVFTVLPETMNY
jgi:hypothetical protein